MFSKYHVPRLKGSNSLLSSIRWQWIIYPSWWGCHFFQDESQRFYLTSDFIIPRGSHAILTHLKMILQFYTCHAKETHSNHAKTVALSKKKSFKNLWEKPEKNWFQKIPHSSNYYSRTHRCIYCVYVLANKAALRQNDVEVGIGPVHSGLSQQVCNQGRKYH